MRQSAAPASLATLDQSNSSAPPMLQRSCPACGCDNRATAASIFSRGEWLIKDCVECQFVYLENALPYSEFIESQAWTTKFRRDCDEMRSAAPTVFRLREAWKRLRKVVMQRDKRRDLVRKWVVGGNLLDVGCSTGRLLDAAAPTVVPFGIEIEASMARKTDARMRRRGGCVIHADALSGLKQFADQFFDGVTMISYLEHELEPAAVLRETRRVLRPQGRLIIKVPNFASWNRLIRGRRWCGFRYPDHVNYFTPTSLARMVEDAGMRIERCQLRDRWPLSDSLWCIARTDR